MVVEVLTAVLVALLALVTVFAAYIGMLGLAGTLRLVRCERCGHLGLSSGFDPPDTCTYCRHDRLFHPLYAVRHAHETYWSQHAVGRHR